MTGQTLNISVIGSMGSGKDLVIEHAIKKYGYTRYAFADNVKHVAETWFPDLYGNGKEKPRWLLQAIGTKFREIDKDVWIKAMFNDIDSKQEIAREFKYTPEFIAVTDCRMPNEYEALKERGFTFIRIEADDGVREARMRARGDVFKKEDLRHHTEGFYDSFECEYTISNNGTADEACAQLDKVIEEMREKSDV